MTTKITEQNISNLSNAGVQWQSPKTANFTAVAGEGYFVNTSGGAFTMTLPANPVIGDTISVSMITAGNNLTIARNGNNIDGAASDTSLGSDGDAKTYVFVNASEGFKTLTSTVADTYVAATGGTESTSGNYKIHIFNSSGNFVVSSVSNTAADNEVSYLVVGGGGAGGVGCSAGGAGAGGYREGVSSVDCYSGSPTAATSGITVSAQTYPITVGAGGSGISPYTSPSHPAPSSGTSGSDSTFSTITSSGGGKGGGQPGPSGSQVNGAGGGSGGGGSHYNGTGGSGNTPPVSPSQGNPGFQSQPGTGPAPSDAGGAGGGATAAGTPGSTSHAGGAGATSSITGSAVARAGGGGGSNRCGGSAPDVAGGAGGGGRGGYGSRPNPCAQGTGQAGSANTGGGGGGGKANSPAASNRPYGGSGSGGSGVVIVRYKYQN